MKILILGGTGAMGTPLVNYLSKDKHEVYVTSRSNHTSKDHVHYIIGNAHDYKFIEEVVLKGNYDAIVDFMVYTTNEFKQRYNLFLNNTKHYLFTSSSRVYSNLDNPIKENTPRLLDVTDDKEYLNTDEYALTKARQEDLLTSSGKTNYTIIRPYITYNDARLQLGTLEKETWLYRALKGRSIPFPKDVANSYTTLTYGDNVALAISKLINNTKAYGQVIHLTTSKYIKWEEAYKVYKEVLKDKLGLEVKLWNPDNSLVLQDIIGNKYQTQYDRLYTRIFDNSKMLEICGDIKLIDPKDGLKKCLENCIDNNIMSKVEANPKLEATLNKITNEKIDLNEFKSIKSKLKYLGWRYAPGLLNVLRKLK